jgi:hypothetical protein
MQAGNASASSAPPSTGGAVYEYANYFEAGFSREEILLRFAQAYDGQGELVEHIRIVMTPTYARALLQLLQSTLARFDAVHEALQHADAATPAAAADPQGPADA